MNNTHLSLRLLVGQQYLASTFIARVFIAIGVTIILISITSGLLTEQPQESLRIALLSGLLVGILVIVVSAIYIAFKEYQFFKRRGKIGRYVREDGSLNPKIQEDPDFKFLGL